ncbi:MAG TPA: hypothetical protein VGR45_06730, partial [Stellaceae bacterium]|nr:hypothetical protein [Stellaceae bacterium]
MHIAKTIVALALAGAVAGCYPPTQTQYPPEVVEQPQPVHFFYGTLIAQPRQVSLHYGDTAGFGAALFPTSPYLAGVQISGRGGTAGLGAAVAGYGVLAAGTVPNLPATEYTIMP